MIADWASESDSFGIERPMEMVEFHKQRYQELTDQ